jgi:serine/threonine protein kinase
MEEVSIVSDIKKAREMSYSSHLKVSQGDVIGNYIADAPLGSGRFATVWSAEGHNKFGGSSGNNSNGDSSGGSVVAVKVYRSGRTNQEYWRNEVKILNLLVERAALSGITSPNIISYYGSFAVVHIDDLLEPNIHPCIIFGLAGDSVSRLLKYCRREYSAGVPLECARKVIRDSLRGLEFIHSAGLIHTDIKPSNLLLDRAISSIDGLDFNVLIGDFGSSTPATELFSRHVGTDLYLAPELLLERNYTNAVDIWAMFTTAFELVTGDPIFDVFREFEIHYGDDVDDEALDGLEHNGSSSSEDDARGSVVMSDANCGDGNGHRASIDSECAGGECEGGECGCKSGKQGGKCGGCDDGCEECCKMDCESSEGSSSGSEDPEKLALIAYRHLLLMEKVLGSPGRSFAKNARAYYNARGKLKNNPAIAHISISELLAQNYDMSHGDCKALEEFLLTGLKYNPDERISAADALRHPWLQ